MGEGNLTQRQKEKCADALVLKTLLENPLVEGGHLCWRVNSLHDLEDSPLGWLPRDWLGCWVLSQGSYSLAPCINPLVVLSQL